MSYVFYKETSQTVNDVREYIATHKLDYAIITHVEIKENDSVISYKYPTVEAQIKEFWDKFVNELTDEMIQKELDKGYLTFKIQHSNKKGHFSHANSSPSSICNSIATRAIEEIIKSYPFFKATPKAHLSLYMGYK